MGLIVFLTSFTIEPLVGYVQNRFKLNPYARLEWYTNGSLQLQRLAHEELGIGTWTRCDSDIPSTNPGVLLASLDLSNPEHPSLDAAHKNNVANLGAAEVAEFDDLLVLGIREAAEEQRAPSQRQYGVWG